MVGPGAEIRRTLVTARETFGEIMTAGAQGSSFFLSGPNRTLGERLLDLAPRTTDDELATGLTRGGTAWSDAFANSRPGGVAVIGEKQGFTTQREAGEEKARSIRQVDAARSGLQSVNDGLARLNVLERKAPLSPA
jgi:hypothetical protein